MTRIIFNSRTEAHLLHHFQIVFGAHLEPLCFQQLALRFKRGNPLPELLTNRENRPLHFLGRRHELFAGVHGYTGQSLVSFACQRLEASNPLDLVSKELDAQSIFRISRTKLDRIPTHTKMSAAELDIVSIILDIYQPQQELLARDFLPNMQRHYHRFIVFFAANAVYARYARDHDNIAPREQRTHCRKPQALDFPVYAGILFDKRVRSRDIRLRLIIIEIAHKIFDRVVGKKTLEFGIELGRKRFVMRNNQGGFANVPDDIGHRECFARSCDAKQHLVLCACLQPFRQLCNRFGLISGWLIRGNELEHARIKLGTGAERVKCWHPESGRGLPQSKTFGGSFAAVVAKRLGVQQSSAAFEHATQSFLCVAVWQFGLGAPLRASQPFRLSRAGQASLPLRLHGPAAACRASLSLGQSVFRLHVRACLCIQALV